MNCPARLVVIYPILLHTPLGQPDVTDLSNYIEHPCVVLDGHGIFAQHATAAGEAFIDGEQRTMPVPHRPKYETVGFGGLKRRIQ